MPSKFKNKRESGLNELEEIWEKIEKKIDNKQKNITTEVPNLINHIKKENVKVNNLIKKKAIQIAIELKAALESGDIKELDKWGARK